jgi:hypothetical protein
MHPLLLVVLCAATLFAQDPKPAPAKVSPQEPAVKPARIGVVEFDSNGYPVVQDDPGTMSRPAAPLVESRSDKAAPRAPMGTAPNFDRGFEVSPADARGSGRTTPAIASGMEPGSPLLDVFQFTRSPGAWKALGGVTLWWLVTVYGAQGEVIGYRELTQTSDCRYPDRDRLEYVNGTSNRTYGRSGATVFAERDGRPLFTAVEGAGSELALFGLQLRMPWAFGDASSYVVLSRDVVTRAEEQLQRILIERRPPPGLDVFGPEVDPRPRDRFELLYEPTSGRPRELVHRFAASGETRRLRLEDWAEFQGLPYPRRRVYVDDSGRATTTLELRRIESANVTERDFRML